MSDTFKLFRLQQIDTLQDRAHTRLAEIATLLTQDEILRQAEQEAKSIEEALQACRRELRRAEEEVTAQRIKIELTESTLYGGRVRNPKELQDMQNEAAALKRYRSVLEDRQLEAMIAAEEAEAADQRAHKRLEAVQREHAERSQALIGEQSNLEKDLVRLENERQATAAGIAQDDLGLYEQLRKIRRGVAVAKVSGGACAACGTILSSTRLHTSRSPGQITRCDTCGRILYGG